MGPGRAERADPRSGGQGGAQRQHGRQAEVDATQALLQATGLSVSFGPIVALDRVDLRVDPGEVLAIAGENGAGKSTLVRCLCGDVTPERGAISLLGETVTGDARLAARLGIAVVWQDLSLCDNLDIAANLLLGRETRRTMMSATRFHEEAGALLQELGMRLPPVGTPVSELPGNQRQLVAVARAMISKPRVLALDEPTASLGVEESAAVEQLTLSLPQKGTSVLIVTHDLDQMFRLADRIVVLRRGRVVGEVVPSESHPDVVAALLAGQDLDDSARQQLTRLHSLTGQLAVAEPSTGLELIVSALGAALGVDRLCVHALDGQSMRLAGSVGLSGRLADSLEVLGPPQAAGQIGRALLTSRPALSDNVAGDPGWLRWRADLLDAGVAASWSVPFAVAGEGAAVVTILSPTTGAPTRDELELASLYAGYAASALERDRLLGEATARNRVLEAITDVLQVLAGPGSTESALSSALNVLHAGSGASSVALIGSSSAGPVVRAAAGTSVTGEWARRASSLLRRDRLGGPSVWSSDGPGGPVLVRTFQAPDGLAALVTQWPDGVRADLSTEALIDDAANSLRLALEREASERAQSEAVALRRSQDQQQQFLSRLSHELRTPLTAIRGYASSLMSTDVAWDGVSQQRFLQRIGQESARLGRLVDDLLDFSAIESGIMRLQPDWCDLRLVAEAARACLAEESRQYVAIVGDPELSVIWADHDRLEQVFVNLLDNAVRHNPPGTQVVLTAVPGPGAEITITVADDGVGPPEYRVSSGWDNLRPERRSRSGGAGLGLSIAKGIVEAHGGDLSISSGHRGTECVIRLPVALGAPSDVVADGATTEAGAGGGAA